MQVIKLSFIQQVFVQSFSVKQDNFNNTWHKMKSIMFIHFSRRGGWGGGGLGGSVGWLHL